MSTINYKRYRSELLFISDIDVVNKYWNTERICKMFGIRQVVLFNLEKSGWLKSYFYKGMRVYKKDDFYLLNELEIIQIKGLSEMN